MTEEVSMSGTSPSTFCTIERPTERGDWYAFLSPSAFDLDGENDASGPFTLVREIEGVERVQVRFGGRGGAIIASTPDADREALVVASVRAMRAHWQKDYKKNDARPGAIPSTIIALAQGAARTLAQGASVRKTLGLLPASRRVQNAQAILEKAAEKNGK
jgi:hypothetical protein